MTARPPPQIADRFGVSEKHVEQRLKLGKAAPELLAEYRAEQITLESLMAFTITDDRERQLQGLCVAARLAEGRSPPHPGIADRNRWPRPTASSPASSGWTPTTPLAARRGPTCSAMTSIWKTRSCCNRLAGEKLDGVRQELEAEGWGWVEVSPERDWSFACQCRRIHPQPADAPPELLAAKEQVEAELEEIRPGP